jgi:Fur family ferric uptake transcriptional regulator
MLHNVVTTAQAILRRSRYHGAAAPFSERACRGGGFVNTVRITDVETELRDEAHRQFEAHLRTQGLKQTRQRQLILDTFLASGKHLTAEDLYLEVQRRNAGVGFATVYRTLHLMVDAGIAREREFSAGRKFYEHVVGEAHHHHHLICTRCDRIVEFICPEVVEQAQINTAKEHGFQLTSHVHELFGICADCLQRGPTR